MVPSLLLVDGIVSLRLDGKVASLFLVDGMVTLLMLVDGMALFIIPNIAILSGFQKEVTFLLISASIH